MKTIPLTQGQFALVDDEDFDRVNTIKWYTLVKENKRMYAVHGQNPGTLYMHIFITGNVMTDHKDFNGLNNQKSNLRNCTSSQNQANRRKFPNKSSKYKGVSFFKTNNTWRAQITVQYTRIHLGHFKSEIDAALAYDEAAIEYFGEFAYTNFAKAAL